MTKTICALLFMVFTMSIARGQGTIEPEIEGTKLYLTILSPGLYVEQRLANKFTFLAGFDLAVSASASASSDGNNQTFYALSPRVRGELRGYYNRKNQKLDLNANSGNFAGLTSGYFMSPVASSLEEGRFMQSDNAFYIGPIWGIQRNYKTGFRLELTLGYGFITGDYVEQNGIFLGDFSLGFVLK